MNILFEHYYEICRALIDVIGMDEISEENRAAMVALLDFNFEQLGKSYWSDKSDIASEVVG